MPKGIRQIKDVHSNVEDKNAEDKKKSRIYSTARINQMLDDLNNGGEPDMTPFWHGMQQYRDHGVRFEYTQEELDEIDKCSLDPIYFISHYATFVNDRGRSLVKLRDYQERTIRLYGDEVWDPVSETVIPKNRRIVIMQSRQTGKCVTMDTKVYVNENIDISQYNIINFFKAIFQSIKHIFKKE